MKAADVRNRISEVRRVRFGDVQAHPGNFRRHPANQRKALEGVVGEVGFASVPLAYHSQRNGGGLTWLDGHLRSEAFPDYEGDVAVLDVDDGEAALLLATLDPLAALATHDAEALDALLRDVQTGDAAVQELLADVAAQAGLYAEAVTTDTEPEIDRAEELRQKWGVSAGDLWQLGEHRLLCGDCTDKAVVERVMPTPADLMLTDPPYCSGGFQEAGRSAGSVGTTAVVYKRVANDTLSTRGYMALMKAALQSYGGLAVYIFTDWRMWVNLFDVVESSGFGVRQMIVWDKGTPGMGHGWRSQHELIMFAMKGTMAFDKFAHAQGNVITCPRTGNEHHTTEKPVALLESVLRVTPEALTVFDPFCGSGSTLIACENVGRRCMGVELDPAYVAVALERWAVHTNRTPVRLP